MSTMSMAISVAKESSSFRTRIKKLLPSTDTTISSCPLCFEETDSRSPSGNNVVVLSTCKHHSCRTCLVKWIQKEEASGQTKPPTCPFCRSSICNKDVQVVLGRPFKPRQPRAEASFDDDEMDDLTMQWLGEHTVPCRGCGSHIEKKDGCNLLECLCGFRFCYGCGAVGGDCECNPDHWFEGDAEKVILAGVAFDGLLFWLVILLQLYLGVD